MSKLATQPYKGARDFYPDQLRLRSYVFEKWRKVARKFGYQEYDAPILEPFELFAAKSGEEIVSEQLFNFEDKAGRRLAIRPELTPSTVRMLAGKYNELVKPARWFMIGNNWRYERPQKGRGREFFQLEVNIFGEASVDADFEIFQVIIAVMQEFGANDTNFSVNVSDRKLLKALLADELMLSAEQVLSARRIMDKWKKISPEDFSAMLKQAGIGEEAIKKIAEFMNTEFADLEKVVSSKILNDNKGYQDLFKLFSLLKKNGLESFVKFDPGIIRGFDYSDGLVYEVFDKNPENRRSLFGGERFDKLISIFDDSFDLPATGFAMGDITLEEFLTGWSLLPELQQSTQVYVTLFEESFRDQTLETAVILREHGINTITALSAEKMDKQLKYAHKLGIPYVIIIGPDEAASGKVSLKKLQTGEQVTDTIEEIIGTIQI